jgi:hypothetical protein
MTASIGHDRNPLRERVSCDPEFRNRVFAEAGNLMYAACPFCRQTLHVEPQRLGVSVKCPKCGGTFVVQSQPGVSDNQAEYSEPDVIPPAILWTIIIAGHFVAGIILAIPFGLVFSIFLVAVAAAIEVGIWQRKRVFWLINKIAEGSAKRRTRSEALDLAQLYSPSQPSRPEREADTSQSAPQTRNQPAQVREQEKRWSTPAIEAERPVSPSVRSTSATVVEIGFKDELLPPRPRTPPQPIPRWPSFFGSSGNRKSISSLNEQRAVLPALQVRFFGPGAVLDIGRCQLRGPLVYATADARHGTFDASATPCSTSLLESW